MTTAMRLSILAICTVAGATVSAADWPAWRGPSGSSSTSDAALPVTWSATQNVAWKAPVAGLGVSSPVVSGGRVFVTSQLGTGSRRAGNHPRLVQSGDASAAGERALGASGAHRWRSRAGRLALQEPGASPQKVRDRAWRLPDMHCSVPRLKDGAAQRQRRGPSAGWRDVRSGAAP